MQELKINSLNNYITFMDVSQMDVSFYIYNLNYYVSYLRKRYYLNNKQINYACWQTIFDFQLI